MNADAVAMSGVGLKCGGCDEDEVVYAFCDEAMNTAAADNFVDAADAVRGDRHRMRRRERELVAGKVRIEFAEAVIGEGDPLSFGA